MGLYVSQRTLYLLKLNITLPSFQLFFCMCIRYDFPLVVCIPWEKKSKEIEMTQVICESFVLLF